MFMSSFDLNVVLVNLKKLIKSKKELRTGKT